MSNQQNDTLIDNFMDLESQVPPDEYNAIYEEYLKGNLEAVYWLVRKYYQPSLLLNK
jgi:hypothetical protein